METHTAEQSSQIVADIGLLLFITFSGLKYDIYIWFRLCRPKWDMNKVYTNMPTTTEGRVDYILGPQFSQQPPALKTMSDKVQTQTNTR